MVDHTTWHIHLWSAPGVLIALGAACYRTAADDELGADREVGIESQPRRTKPKRKPAGKLDDFPIIDLAILPEEEVICVILRLAEEGRRQRMPLNPQGRPAVVICVGRA